MPRVRLRPGETLVAAYEHLGCSCRVEIKGPNYQVDKWLPCGLVDHDLDRMLMSVGERVLGTISVWIQPSIEQPFQETPCRG